MKVGVGAAGDLRLRGGFPRLFLAPSIDVSADWRRAFIQTFLERDIPELGIQVPSTTFHRFWRLLAHYHGQVWNGVELARAFGVAATTVRRYLDLLTATLVLRRLPTGMHTAAPSPLELPQDVKRLMPESTRPRTRGGPRKEAPLDVAERPHVDRLSR